MREWMNLIENASAFAGLYLQRIVLPKGTVLFHGTSRPLEEWNPAQEPIFSPAWFGLDFNIAASYAKYLRGGAGGPPVVIQYVLHRDMSLLEASTPEVSEIMDKLYDEYTTDEIAENVLAMGFDGWHIKGEEIMLGDTDELQFVKIVPA